MSIKEVERELDRLVEALSKPKPIKEFDVLVSRYNALKIKHCIMTGEPIVLTSLDIEYKQFINVRNHG